MKLKDYLVIFPFSLLCNTSLFAQVTVDTSPTATQMAQLLAGPGVNISNATFKGGGAAKGIFNGTSNLGIANGIVLCTGKADSMAGPNNLAGVSHYWNKPGDSLLNTTAAGLDTYDAAILEFDIVPQFDTLKLKYVFGSDEYPEYVTSFNDAFAIFISGPGISGSVNIALIPGTSVPVSLSTVNASINSDLYVDNGSGLTPSTNATIQYDGFTVLMTALSKVIPCRSYHLKIVVADGRDSTIDSGVMLEAASLSSKPSQVSMCSGGSTTIGVARVSGYIYSWTPTLGLQHPDSSSTSISLTNTGNSLYTTQYVLKGSNSSCHFYDTFLVNVRPVVSSTFTHNGPVCLANTGTVTYTGNAFTGAGFSWNVDGGNILSGTGGGLLKVSWNSPGYKKLSLRVVSAGCLSEFTYDSILVKPPLKVQPRPDTTLCHGRQLQLSASSKGGDTTAHFYTWQRANSLQSSWSGVGTGNNITVTPAASVIYRVILSDNCTPPDTGYVIVTVKAPLSINPGADTTICSGQSALLNASASGGISSAHQIEWNHGLGKGKSFTVNPSVTTTYRAILTDGCSRPDTAEVKVIIRDALKVTAINDTTICSGQQLLLSASGAGGHVPDHFFSWNNGSGNGSSKWVAPPSNTTYRVVLSDNCSRDNDTDYVHVNVRQPLKVVSRPDTLICSGQAVNLFASASGGNSSNWQFSWDHSAGTGNNISVSPAITTTYMVVLSDNCSPANDTAYSTIKVRPLLNITPRLDTTICRGQNVLLNAKAAGGDSLSYSIYWEVPGPGGNNGWILAGQGAVMVSPGVNTTYRVILADNCSSLPDTDYVTISVRDPLQVAARTDTTICIGQGVRLFANSAGGYSPGYTFKWDQGLGSGKLKFVSPSTTTQYRVILSDNCTSKPDTAYVTITVRAPLLVKALNDTTICAGQQVSLYATASGGYPAGYRYSWDNGAGTGNPAHIIPSATTTYTVTLTDQCTDGEDTAMVTVTVRDPLEISVSPLTHTLCYGQGVPISASGKGGNGNYSFSWDNGIGPVSSIIVYPPTTTEYTVILSDGCTSLPDTGKIRVFVTPPLHVAARPDTFMCSGNSTALYARASGGDHNNYTYSWFGLNGSTWHFIDTGNYKPVSPAATAVYRVVTSDGCSANDTDEVTVHIRIPLKLQVTRDTIICAGQQVILSASGAGNDSVYYTYTWDHNIGNGNYRPVSPASTTNYRLLAKDNCAMTTDTHFVNVVVRDSLKIIPRDDSTICIGQGISLYAAATGGDNSHYSFTWEQGLGPGNNILVHPAVTTVYKVNVTDYCSPSPVSASIKIEVRPELKINPTTDTTICYGQSINLSVQGTGGNAPSYHYSWNYGTDSGSTILVAPLSTSVYEVILSDGCTNLPDTERVNVIVRSPLEVTLTSDTTICSGQQLTLHAAGSGGISSSYKFSWKNFTPTGNLLLVAPKFTTTYRVILSDNCTRFNDTGFVKVTVRPPLHVSAGKDTSICFGQNVTLQAKGYWGDFNAHAYSWEQKDNSGSWNLVGNDAFLSVSPVADASYRVILKDNCSLRNDTDLVNVFVSKPLQINAGNDTTICYGQEIRIAAVASGGNSSNYAYDWNHGLGKSATQVIKPLTSAVYRVVLSDQCSLFPDTDYVTINVRDPLKIATSSDTTICLGQSVDLTASGSGGLVSSHQLTWDSGAGSGKTKTVSPATSTTYTVVLSDNCSPAADSASIRITVRAPLKVQARSDTTICSGQSLRMFATISGGNSQAYKFSWNKGLAGISNQKISPKETTVYRVIATDNCSAPDTAYVRVEVRKPLKVIAGSSLNVCFGQVVDLNAEGSGGDSLNYTFSWNNGLGIGKTHSVYAGISTKYRVVLTDHCSNKADTGYVNVVVRPALKISARAFTKICEGNSVYLFADASGGDDQNYAYSWDHGIGSGRSAVIQPANTATYTVTVKDGCSIPAHDTVTVQVMPLPAVDFVVDANSICTKEKVTFINKSGGGPGSRYLWSFSDQTTSTDENPEHHFLSSGTYSASLRVISPGGCADSITRNSLVTVNPLPSGQFVASPGITNILSPIIKFDNFSAGAVRYKWDMGDGKGTSSQESMDYEYLDTGRFQVKMVAFNDFGCVDTVMRPVKIADVYRFFVPTAFTPNGDGLNDTFHPTGMGIRSYETSIFNRWGQLIFKSYDMRAGWNGSVFNSGDKVPYEIYQYIFKVTDFEGKEHHYQGSVTVLSADE
jgi:gliding motility-associated-like protein